MFTGFWSNVVDWLPSLLHGAAMTLILSVLIFALGTAFGCVVAIIRIAGIPIVNIVLVIYVEMFRGVPAIVLLFFAYFGLPAAGLQISTNPVIVGVAALSLQHAAYASEVFRAAILSIDHGQMRAGLSLGMSRRRTYRKVVLPQAFLVAVPTLGTFAIAILKETSLLSFISVSDLLKAGNDIVAATYLSFQAYTAVGAIYIIMSIAASKVVLMIEARLRHEPARTASKSGRPSESFDGSVLGQGVL